MKILILYCSTAAILFTPDLIGFRLIINPVFERHVGHLLADPIRAIPAILFYLGYVAGVLWFVSVPALRADDPAAALVGGVALGLWPMAHMNSPTMPSCGTGRSNRSSATPFGVGF